MRGQHRVAFDDIKIFRFLMRARLRRRQRLAGTPPRPAECAVAQAAFLLLLSMPCFTTRSTPPPAYRRYSSPTWPRADHHFADAATTAHAQSGSNTGGGRRDINDISFQRDAPRTLFPHCLSMQMLLRGSASLLLLRGRCLLLRETAGGTGAIFLDDSSRHAPAIIFTPTHRFRCDTMDWIGFYLCCVYWAAADVSSPRRWRRFRHIRVR